MHIRQNTTWPTHEIYITSPLTTGPPSDTPHSQLPIYTASPLTHTSQYNMTDTRHATFTNLHGVTIQHDRHTNLPGITPYTYVTIQHGRHTKYTLRHPKQHGRRAARCIHNYQSTRHHPFHIRHNTTWPTHQKYQYTRTHKKISAFDLFLRCLLQDVVDSTGYTVEWIQLATIFATITSSPGP
jgi:hypothetical protein